MADSKGLLVRKLQWLRTADLKEANRQAVLRYIQFKQSQGLSYSRLDKILALLQSFLKWADFEIPAIRQEDMERFAIVINSSNLKDWTKVGQIKVMKTFLYWLREEYGIAIRPEKLKAAPPKNSIMPEYLITEEEFKDMMSVIDDAQTKLLLGLLYESGARISEILGLRLQSVSFNTYGARLALKGKTGQRMVPIVWFSSLLRQFMEIHPRKNEPEALLWYSEVKGGIRPLNYDVVRMRITRLCRRAGIKKRIHPHLFRHTRMTELAKQGIGEQTLKAYAGWAGDSKMASIYVHLANKDVEENLLSKAYGIKINESNPKEKLRICVRCAEPNPFFARLCQRCKMPLDEKEVREEVLSDGKAREIEGWSRTFMAFLKVVEKKHPDIWDDMKEVMGSNAGLPI
jgi:site-specific recombinase XerD